MLRLTTFGPPASARAGTAQCAIPTRKNAAHGSPAFLVFVLSVLLAFTTRAAVAPVDKAWLEANYTKQQVQIRMRDGVQLFTVIYSPRDLSATYPIWMERTAYGVGPYEPDVFPNPDGPLKYYAREKFIFVEQDVRGRNHSEGKYVDTRPLRTKKSKPGDIDESTDAWDTIDWLVKHVANNNGRVGLSGISDPGFYAACGAVNNHPALKAVSPQAPDTDSFVGDDFHHNGAFFLPHAVEFYSWFGGTELKDEDYGTQDGYQFYLKLGPVANLDTRYFHGRNEFWNDLMQHGTRDEYYQVRDPGPQLLNIHAAVLTVGGWFDAEDLYGALHVYRSIQRQDPGIVNLLVMGPWSHGAWGNPSTRHFGALDFGSNPAEFFRQNIELPFFEHYLKDAPDPGLPKAFMFETGANQWHRFAAWPPTNAVSRTLYFHPGGQLGFDAPQKKDRGFDEYVSDPSHPVPYFSRLSLDMAAEYMADDQRPVSKRADVLVFQTGPLATDVTLAGPVTARLKVSTSGTDSDWIVKLIDVYPADFPNPNPNPRGLVMGGYQQLVRGEPMRGKFRRSLAKPEPFTPGKVTPIDWVMPDIFHTFRRGHRLMIQVQSSWFPLMDRNPQTFCDIYHATEADFQKATERVYHSAAEASGIEVEVLPEGK